MYPLLHSVSFAMKPIVSPECLLRYTLLDLTNETQGSRLCLDEGSIASCRLQPEWGEDSGGLGVAVYEACFAGL